MLGVRDLEPCESERQNRLVKWRKKTQTCSDDRPGRATASLSPMHLDGAPIAAGAAKASWLRGSFDSG